MNNAQGDPVYSAYQPLSIEGLHWALLTDVSVAEANRPVLAHQRLLLVAATIAALIFTLLAIVLAAIFMRPADRLLAAAQQMVDGAGDVQINLYTDDEYGRLAQSLRQLKGKLDDQAEALTHKDSELDAMLEHILPNRLARRVRQGETRISETDQMVTVLYTHFSGFVRIYKDKSLPESAAYLADFQEIFEQAAAQHGLEPQRTVGNRSIAVCGLGATHLDHTIRTVDLAVTLLTQQQEINHEHDVDVALHIGIHTGLLLQDVTGEDKIRYILWGDPLHVASRLSSVAEPNTILVSDDVRQHLDASYSFVEHEPISVEEVGEITTWVLTLGSASNGHTMPQPTMTAA